VLIVSPKMDIARNLQKASNLSINDPFCYWTLGSFTLGLLDQSEHFGKSMTVVVQDLGVLKLQLSSFNYHEYI
jgi:hypothetical protein